MASYSGYAQFKYVDIETQGMVTFGHFLLFLVITLSQLGFSFALMGFTYTFKRWT